MNLDLPFARTNGLTTEAVEDSLFIYDGDGAFVCRLNATAALVWRSCDGRHSIEDLARELRDECGPDADEDLVLIALDDLVAHDLIASGYDPRPATASRLSRRRFLRRVGLAGAAAVAIPVVYGAAPTIAAASEIPHY